MIDQYLNVKILFAHGGGFLPYQIGRLDKGYEHWGLVSSILKGKPSEYLNRFWYDTVLWSPESIEYLIQTVEEDRVVPGSDYPFDLSMWPPKDFLTKGVCSLLS